MAAIMKRAPFTTLLNQIAPGQDVWLKIRSSTAIEVGVSPDKPEYVIDFARERLTKLDEGEARAEAEPLRSTPLPAIQQPALAKAANPYPGMPGNGRHTGMYTFLLRGNEVRGTSLRSFLLRALYCIECEAPGTLEKLASVKNQTKRIVAGDRSDLFTGKNDEFIEKHTFDLGNGFYAGTNNSKPEVMGWLRKAVEVANLQWGVDFKVVSGTKIELTDEAGGH